MPKSDAIKQYRQELRSSPRANDLKNLLRSLNSDNLRLAKYLNMLSMIEYIGQRQLLMSFPYENVDQDVISHIIDEARHVKVFRGMAERIGGREMSFSEEDVPARRALEHYMKTLGAYIWAVLHETPRETNRILFIKYLSLFIELRVEWWFPVIYESITHKEVRPYLDGIIKEEVGHLVDLEETIGRMDKDYARHAALFARKEQERFDRFLASQIRKFSA